MFQLLPLAARRWPHALRASLCMGVPVITGVVYGDIGAGLLATIGGFTALYGSGRPYLHRAMELAWIGLAFAVAISLGNWAATLSGFTVPLIALIAMLATWLCNALRVGPPGAYLFTLACAAGSAMPITHISHWHAGLLVLSGAAFAWMVHMSGALSDPRKPEKTAVTTAANAVASFIEALHSPQQDAARHQAALALHQAWTVLVSDQPARIRAGGRLSRLRQLNRELHALFASALRAANGQEALPAGSLKRVRAITIQAAALPQSLNDHEANPIPLGHPGRVQALRESLDHRSMAFRVVMRVGLAALVAGAIASIFGLERAYWAIAAAVLILHQGFDWARSLQRGLERTLGTWAGLLLAGMILSVHPQGLWLAASIMLLQFLIDMIVLRNYPLAVVLITGVALTLASGGQHVHDVTNLLLARGLDTTLGCAVAIAVLALTRPRQSAPRIKDQLTGALDGVARTLIHLASADVVSVTARVTRRDLQRCSFALAEAYDAGAGASLRRRQDTEQLWPAVAATQNLIYRTLAACWQMELSERDATDADVQHALFSGDDAERVQTVLHGLASAIRDATPPAELGLLPVFLQVELQNLRQALRTEAA